MGKFYTLRALVLVVLLGVAGRGWGQYTYTFTSSQFTASPQTKTLGTTDWTLTNNGSFYGYDATKGQQIGSSTNPATSMTLSTTGISGVIQSVKIYTSGASSVVATVAVSVGGTAYGSSAAITATNTQYIFTGSSSGQLLISWAQTSAKALYFKQIDITYLSCTAPTTQATSLSSNNITTDGFKLVWTAGDGNGTLLAVRPTSAALTAPSSGTAYSPNLAWASAGQIDANNRVVFRTLGTTAGPITGLSPETQYTATAYEYNSTADCYNITSPPTTTQYTLSLEPSAHAATLTATTVSSTEVNLAFSAASTITNADGYMIVSCSGSGCTPGTNFLADGGAPGTPPVGTTLIANISNTSTATYSHTGLTANTNYCYFIIPYNWNSSNVSTYNYYTAGTPIKACATTSAAPAPSITSSLTQSSIYGTVVNYTITAANSPTSFDATGLPAGLSVNTTNGIISGTPTVDVGTYNINISAANNSGTDNKTLVLTITARPLTITGISASNKIYDGNTTATLGGTPLLNNVVFSDDVSVSGTGTGVFSSKTVATGKMVTVAGYTLSGTKAGNYTVSQPTSIVANITVKSLTVTGAAAQSKSYDGTTTATITGAVLVGIVSPDVVTVSGGGTFASANVGTAISVTAGLTLGGADVGNYSLTQPTGLSANITAIAPTFTTSPIGVTIGGTFTLPGSNVSSNSLGTITYLLGTASPAGSITLTGGNVLNGIAAGTATLTVNQAASGNYTAGSTTVSVTANDYLNGDFRTTGDGTWHSTVGSGTSTWQQYSGGTWTNSTAPSTNTSNNVYILNSITLVGTNTAGNVIIGSTGVLYTSTVTATFGNLLVKTGGIFNRQSNGSGVTGIFEVEDNALVNFYHTNNTSRSSSIWAGTEKFHPNSNFVIKSGNNTSNFLDIENINDVSLYNNVACFGNLIVDLTAGQLQLLPSGFTRALTAGNLIFRNLNGNNLRISDGNYSTTILGNIEIESTVANSITMLTTTGATSITVKGNFNHNGSAAFRLANNTTSIISSILAVEGDINIGGNGSNIDFNGNTNAGDQTTSTIDVKGDLYIAATAHLTSTNTIHPGILNFSGIGNGLTPATTQTVSIASTAATTRNQNITGNVGTGAYVQLINSNWELGKNSTVAVGTNGTLDFGFMGTTALNITSVASATGTGFSSATGSTLKITSPDGINNSSGTLGNVQTTTAPVYNQAANFWYIGKGNQVTGTVFGAGGGAARNIYINLADNTKTLIPNITTSISATGKVEVQKGIVINTPTANFTGGDGKLIMSDGVFQTSETAGTVPSLGINNTSNYSLSGGLIELSAATNQVLKGGVSYYNLKFSNGGTKSITNGTSGVAGSITTSDAAIVDVANNTLGGSSTTLIMTGTSRYITAGTGTKPDAGGTYTLGSGTTIEFTNTNATAQEVRLSPSYFNIDVSGSNVINGSTVNTPIKMQSGATFTVKSTGTFKVQNTNGFYGTSNTAVSNANLPTVVLETGSTIEYNSTSAQMVTSRTSPNSYSNVTISNPATKTLAGDITIDKVLTLNSNPLVTNSSKVIISSGGSVSNGTQSSPTGWVAGYLQKAVSATGSLNFEIGGTDSYRPVNLTINSAPSGNLTAFVTQSSASYSPLTGSGLDASKTLQRNYKLTGTFAGNYDAIFNFISSDVPSGADPTTFVARNTSNSGSTWTAPITGLRTSSSTQSTGISTFGDFVIGNSTTLTVTTQPVDQAICEGGNVSFAASASIAPSVSSTPISVQWQLSTDGGSLWSNISSGGVYTINNSGTNPFSSTLNIAGAATTMHLFKYRAVFADLNGNATSAAATLTVNAASVSGSITGATTVCTGTNSTTLTLSGYTGNIRWQSSGDNSTFTNISGATSSTYTATNLSATTYYRAVVTSGVCSSATSLSATITVNPASISGNITGATTVCTGTNSTPLTLSGYTGNIQWQSSGDNSTFNNISGATSPTYTATNLSATTYYRAVVTSGVCASAISNVATVTVTPSVGTPVFSSGSMSTRCQGAGSATYTATASNITGITYALDAASLSAGNSIDAASGTVTYSASYSGTAVITANATGCGSSSSTFTVSININTWNGITDNNWNTPSNWLCGTVPLFSENAIIPAVTPLPVLTGNASINNLTIQTGAYVTIDGNTLTINGNISGSGALTGSLTSNLTVNGTGTVNFTPTFPNNLLNNFTINSPAGTVSLGTDLNMAGILTPTAGIFNLNGKAITLMAGTKGETLYQNLTAYPQTAIVGSVGATITYGSGGHFVVERYIPDNNRAFRDLSPSVNSANSAKRTMLNNWMEGAVSRSYATNMNPVPGYGTHISGSANVTDSLDVTRTNNASLYKYNNSGSGFYAVTNSHQNLFAGDPWRVLIRGDRGTDLSTNTPHAVAAILRSYGQLLTGTVIFSAEGSTPSNLPKLNGNPSGISMIGNPYASPVLWSSLAAFDPAPPHNLTGPAKDIKTDYTVFDASFNSRGSYVTFNGVLGLSLNGSSNVNGTIQPGQAFFIQNNGNNPSIEFQESYKSTSGFTQVYRGNADTTKLSVQLLFNNNGGNENIADGLVVVFGDNFSRNINNEDSYKFINPDENIAINVHDTSISIEGRPYVNMNDTILLKMWQLRQKSYYFSLRAQNFAPGIDAFLSDSYLKQETPVSLSAATLIPFSLTSDSASFAPDRFMIVFKPSSTLPVTVTDVKAYEKDKGVQVEWVARTEKNIDRYEVEKSADGVHFEKAGVVKAKNNQSIAESYGWFDKSANPGSNFYRIKVIDKSGVVSYTKVVQVFITLSNQGIYLIANPVKDNVIRVKFVDMEKGTYSISLYNNLGQKLYAGQTDHYGGNSNYNYNISKRPIAKGTYRLNIRKGKATTNATLIFE